MNRKTFQNTWYYRLLQVLFWGTLTPLVGILLVSAILGLFGIGEDDVPMAGLIWAVIVITIYWLGKKCLYYILFKESIFPPKK